MWPSTSRNGSKRLIPRHPARAGGASGRSIGAPRAAPASHGEGAPGRARSPTGARRSPAPGQHVAGPQRRARRRAAVNGAKVTSRPGRLRARRSATSRPHEPRAEPARRARPSWAPRRGRTSTTERGEGGAETRSHRGQWTGGGVSSGNTTVTA